MKKFLCALLAMALCATSAAAFSGCGCSSSNTGTNEPGYRVEETKPDIEENGFGFYIINNDELMLTKYSGKETNIKIPDSVNNYKVTKIGPSAFMSSDITSVEITDNVTELQDYAFYGCKSLSKVKLPSKLKTFGTNVFNLCTALTSIDLPASIKDLGIYTFTASGLKTIKIPESKTLTKIDHYVFYQCQSLTDATIPATVTNIEADAFRDCPNKIVMHGAKGTYVQNYAKTNSFDFKEAK